MTTMISVYLGYLAVCILIAFTVARTLRVHGLIYMSERSKDSAALVKAKTHLMVVGFCLVTLGTIGVTLRYDGTAADVRTAIEILSWKLGTVIFLIGFFHFVMIGLFATSNGRESSESRTTLTKPTEVTSFAE